MSEKEFYVEHTETGLVYAEDSDEAYEKAVNGESETGWNTLDLEVEEVTEEDFEGDGNRLELTIKGGMPLEKAEMLEDAIGEFIGDHRVFDVRGQIRSMITGNEVSFNSSKKGESDESAEPVKLNEQETDILRRGGSVEIGGQVITLDEDAEDKHGLGDVV